MVLSKRKFTSFDYGGLRSKAEAAAERLRGINIDTHGRMQAMAEFVSQHCVGLACQQYHVERRINPAAGDD